MPKWRKIDTNNDIRLDATDRMRVMIRTEDYDSQLILSAEHYFCSATAGGWLTKDVRPRLIRSRFQEKALSPPTPITLQTELWATPISPKAKEIWWIMLQQRLPSRSRMHERFARLVISDLCPICETSKEDQEHMIFACPTKRRLCCFAGTLMNLGGQRKIQRSPTYSLSSMGFSSKPPERITTMGEPLTNIIPSQTGNDMVERKSKQMEWPTNLNARLETNTTNLTIFCGRYSS
jgi:hypothetical protein